MTELWNQLKLLGDNISNTMHATRLLMNLPNTENWRLFASSVQIHTQDPSEVARLLTNKYAQDRLFKARTHDITIGVSALQVSETPLRSEESKKSKKKAKKEKQEDTDRFIPKCSYCKRQGHTDDKCYKKAYQIGRAHV